MRGLHAVENTGYSSGYADISAPDCSA